MPTIGEADSPQLWDIYLTVVLRLLHDRRELLMITDQDKFVDAALTVVMGRQQTDDVGFQDLTGFIYDGQGEMFQVKYLGMT
jgi:hypothetical protein